MRIAALVLAGCATALPSAAPGLRLGAGVVPRAEALDLTIDPDRADYSGSAAIEVDVRAPTRTVWLHARGLTIEGGEIEAAGARVAATIQTDENHVGLVVGGALAAGPATLHLRFRGQMNRSDRGVFRKETG